MIINNIPFDVDLMDILLELRRQLAVNNVNLLGTIKSVPGNIMVSCPYHKGGQERKPSAGLKISDGTFHCFTCGETHSLQEMIAHCLGYYDDVVGSHGWDWLLQNFISLDVEVRKDVALDFSRDKCPVPINYVEEDELDKYRYIHPYMYKRKLTDKIIELFDIGYDKETDCITFPVRDDKGNCLFVARRSVKTKFFNYPSGVEKPVYGLYELSGLNYEEIIICESMLDALTCWVYGKYAVALNGTGNDLQFKQLNSLGCRKFILATDNDEAGRKARIRIRKNLKNTLVMEYSYNSYPSHAKDINDMSEEEFNNIVEIF